MIGRVLFFAILFGAICLSSQAASTGYGWPLQENYGVSATFGESRGDHFHAGIDLSTNGQTGLPVLAVADGKITRMKIQKRAYGRALYIEHADGMVSLYAHLESYSTDLGLEQLYQQRVVEAGNRYPGDIFLDPPIAVHKGELVAYSGETGAGLPHLHLELRKNDGTVAINPLLNGFRDLQDQFAPSFQALYLYPRGAASTINGDLETVEVRLKQSEDGSYFPTDMPVVLGDFSVSASVYDETLRPYHRAPEKLVYSIDGREIYSIDFTQLSYVEPAGFGLVYDLGKPGAAYYEWPVRMNNPAGASLPFSINSTVFSTGSLGAGRHQLELAAMDANGNRSVAQVPFFVNHPPVLALESAQPAEPGWLATLVAGDPDAIAGLSTGAEYSTDEGKSFQPLAPSGQESPDTDAIRVQYLIPAPLRGHRLLLRARSFDGVEYSPYSVTELSQGKLPQFRTPAGQIRITPFADAVKVSYETAGVLTQQVTLQYGVDSTAGLQRKDLNLFESILPVPLMNGVLGLKVNGTQSYLPVRFLTAGAPAQVQTQNYSLSIGPDSLYWSTFIWTKSIPGYPARKLPTIGSMLQLGPRGLPLKNHATLSINYPRSVIHPEKLSIYSWDRAGLKWTSLPSPMNSKTRTVQTRIDTLDLYALLYDNVPPTITSMTPRRGSRISDPMPVLSAIARDQGMQIDDTRLFFYVDSVARIAEYDPDRDLATLAITKPLTQGAHTFRVVASDYAGNKTYSPKITFYVR
jgi:hypothetical protein